MKNSNGEVSHYAVFPLLFH